MCGKLLSSNKTCHVLGGQLSTISNLKVTALMQPGSPSPDQNKEETAISQAWSARVRGTTNSYVLKVTLESKPLGVKIVGAATSRPLKSRQIDAQIPLEERAFKDPGLRLSAVAKCLRQRSDKHKACRASA